MKELELKERSSKSLLANVLDMDDDFRAHAHMAPNTVSASYLRSAHIDEGQGCGAAQRELQAILRELQFITSRMRKSDEEADIISDWKFAAMVVDRFCLIIFTMFTVIATVAVLLSAPHIIVQ